MIAKRVGRIVLALVLMSVFFVAAGTSVANAQVCDKTSSVNMSNLDTKTANITITAYKADGTVDGSPFSDTIAVGKGKAYFPIPNISAGFSGALVVSSDASVAAIANIVCTDFSAGGSYVAGTTGATTVNLPVLNKGNGGFTTTFSVQNTAPDEASVTVQYTDGTSASAKIPPNAAAVFDQATENHPQKNFAGTVTSDKPVVASAIQESSSIIFSYLAFSTSGTPKPLFPLVNANNGPYVTAIQIQNGGTQSTDVTVSYTPSGADGTACTETQTIPAGQAKNFTLNVFSGNPTGITTTCINKQKFVGSAVVSANSANQPLIGIINQLGSTDGEAYGSFSADDATEKVSLPLIMDRNGGFFTGINVLNAGTSDTTVNCTFSDASYSVSKTLKPGEALNDLQFNKIADKYVGSGVCTGGSGSKIVAVVNQLGTAAGQDQLYVYEGINN
jgi:hypothetical protein